MKRKFSFVLILVFAVSLLLTACGASAPATAAKNSDVVVLYTNDVHCAADGYVAVAQTKAALEAAGKEVVLVDCGDAVQGDAIGTLSSGEYIVEIMNTMGYAVATLGNHEFDYGMEQFMKLRDMAEYEYVSCNFVDKNGNAILDSYKIVAAGGHKIAFVGITTPQTMTTTNPSNLQGEDGEYVCGFYQDETGEKLYAGVQTAVDAARADGADIVIALAHLGIAKDCEPWTSSDVITNTTGIDVMLDAHSHTVMERELVKNKDGKEVVLTSTGTKLANIGCLMIGADGTFTPTLINDNGVAAVIAEKQENLTEVTEQVVAHTDVDLVVNDPVAKDTVGNAIRIVRSQETNLGDLCADAYRAITGADIAIVNGGGIRAAIPAGDITYGQLISVHPFGNELCMKKVTGQTILDVLEMGVCNLPGESGGFMQVSGITFDVDVNVESTVEIDENGAFVQVAGERRVSNVMVGGEVLDPAKTYTLASHNFLLKDAGDGFSMLSGGELLLDSIMLDNQGLITYITENLEGTVGSDYADPYGQGRINIIQ